MSAGPDAPSWLTAEWLTDVLRRNGDSSGASVESFTVESPRATIISNVMRLRLAYSPPGDAGPRTLFLKMARRDVDAAVARGGSREVSFYSTAAPLTPDGLLPRCYEARYLEEGPTFHLVMEDLSDTHGLVSPWPLPPTVEQCERIIETYARFHAFWWDHPQLGISVGRFSGEHELEGYLAGYERRFAAFADTLGDRLSPERRRIYERIFAMGGRLFERYRTRRDLTLVHGDAHVWNLLYPSEGHGGSIRLIDWDSWRIDTATDDLAYMMAMHWYPERRARLERRFLEMYHRILTEAGVTGHALEALREDYRHSVVGQLAVPVWQCTVKIGAWIWWGHLERIMLAFDDLRCEELLG